MGIPRCCKRQNQAFNLESFCKVVSILLRLALYAGMDKTKCSVMARKLTGL